MLHLITCHGRIMPRLAELLFLFLNECCGYSLEAPPLNENICCGYSLEGWGGASNEYPQHMFSLRTEALPMSTHNICFGRRF